MYSSFHDQREKTLVDSWLTSAAGASADISSPLSKSIYSPLRAVSSTTPFNDLTARHVRFLYTPGSPSTN